MNPFSRAECAVCQDEIGRLSGKFSIKEGNVICASCFMKTGYSPSSYTKVMTKFMQMSAEDINELIQSSKSNALKKEEDKVAEAEAFIAFEESRVIDALHIDDKNQKWYLVSLKRDLPLGTKIYKVNSKIYDFDEIESCEIVEDGTTLETVKKGTGSMLGRAVVGGALFGGAGAIVGAATGTSKGASKFIVDNMDIRIQLRGGVGSVSHSFIESKIIYPCPISSIGYMDVINNLKGYHIASAKQTSSWEDAYKNVIDSAKNMVSAIESIINAVADGKTSAMSKLPVESNTEEIRKYKALLDDGIITQDEFEAKKKQLLGL